MTCQAQEEFGIKPEFDGKSFTVVRDAFYHSPGNVKVECDWSNAAFWIAAAVLSNCRLEVYGLSHNSQQGDKAVIELIKRIQAGNALIDVKDVPDLVPVLSVVAAVCPGKTEFINAGRLRIKESDRIASVCRMLSALGANCEEKAEGLAVYGGNLRGGIVDGENDHRIVMSAAVAAIACREPVTILGTEAVEKSYPTFFEDYKKLGGKIL